MMNRYIKSPIRYMGSKYDLLPCILEQFPNPEEVSVFYDVFGGGASITLNAPYNNIIYNELNNNVVNILNMIKKEKPSDLIKHILSNIEKFKLNIEGTDSRSKKVNDEMREDYNKNFVAFRDFYNKSKTRDVRDLYTLTFYSFCHLMRFNNNNEFNMPYGNCCFSDDNKIEIIQAHNKLNENNIDLRCGDSFELLKNITENKNQFLYFDPPYANSMAIYNESRAFGGWSEEDDYRLFNELDRLTNLGIKWAYSNVLQIKGKINNHIQEWAKRNNYTIIDFDNKEYAALGKGNAKAQEVLIINYEQRVKQFNIFDYIE